MDIVSRLLERDEREAVRGDLVEAGESAWQGLLDVLGLVVRRQAMLWKNWRPWLATFGVALPCTLLLMGFSLMSADLSTLRVDYQEPQFIDPKLLNETGLTVAPGILHLLCYLFLLMPGVDRRFCGGIRIAADGLGKRRFVFLGLSVLLGEVSRGIFIAVLPASLFGPCDLGSSAGFASFPDQTGFGDGSGGGRNGIDDRHIEQQRSVDSQFGAQLAGVVSGCDCIEADLDAEEDRKWLMNLL